MVPKWICYTAANLGVVTTSLLAAEVLHVKAHITNQKYCLGQPDRRAPEALRPGAVTLELQVRLSYSNAGTEPLIVPTLASPSIILSRTVGDAYHRTGQVIVPPRFRTQLGGDYFDEQMEAQGVDLSRPPQVFPHLFDVIQPGLEVENTSGYFAFLVHDPGDTHSEWLGKSVVVQLELDHAVLPNVLASKLRLRWRHLGALWTGSIRSQPIKLRIPSSPEAESCPAYYRLD